MDQRWALTTERDAGREAKRAAEDGAVQKAEDEADRPKLNADQQLLAEDRICVRRVLGHQYMPKTKEAALLFS